MTPAESLQVFGSSINFQFFNGTDYTDAVFTYDTTATVTGYYGDIPTFYDDISGTATYLKYTASVTGLSTNVNYITVDVRPSYSLFDTEQLTTCIALSHTGVYLSTTYQSPSWDWYISGNVEHFENNLTYNTNYHSMLAFNRIRASYVPLQFFSQSTFSGYSQRAVFCGNSPDSGVLTLLIMCPYISADAEGSNGTFTQTSSSSGGGDVNVDVNIDMEETNGLLRGIPDAIGALFLPDDAALEQFHSDMQDLAEDHLGGLYEAVELLDDFAAAFVNVSPQSSLTVPEFHIPLAGSDFVLGGLDMPLVYPQLSSLYTSLAWIIDFLATAAFLNMCKKKLEIFFVPETEKVE